MVTYRDTLEHMLGINLINVIYIYIYICGQSFADKNILNRHIRTHSDDVSCKCDICGKGFIKKG
jgi:uncharacterized Zn-finger protein